MIKHVKIGDRLVGPGQPCFIIAEAGVNHNGDMKQACRLIEAAAEAGVDAIKFQSFVTEELITLRHRKRIIRSKQPEIREANMRC